ncbi:RHS repeat-associated core domain-containing protein [Pseudomonas sp. S32]|uniref:RHS repeat-associated core domain-containing protein n=1 Tax=Pseudomonas sp. S32 TaxID=2767448 RepID=UPI001912583C|nr:RHS repeat-associated core domain-containing protein [Pseudomonas sp. S32]MBK5007213.1 RHS repeat-associated core domain-containing protein [Pseudomonas sp. S32]
MKIFYSDGRLSTLISPKRTIRYYRATSEILAVRDESSNHLVANEVTKSPLGTVSSHTLLPCITSPYGFGKPILPLGFKSERPSPETNHYMLGMGYRAYNPELMRFNSADSASPFARGGVNSYAFTSNDPVNRYDPTGHFFEFVRSALTKLFSKKIYQGRIEAEFDGISAFTAPARTDGKKPTLYIVAHGTPGYLSGDKKSLYDGLRTYKTLTHLGIDMSERPTHFLACDTSLPNPRTGRSIIDDMSSMTGAQSSGYGGTVPISVDRQGSRFTAYKHYALPTHGTTNIKVTVGQIRSPEKFGRAGEDQV